MSLRPNLIERYMDEQGRLTIEGVKLLNDLFLRIEAAETALSAISQITAPTGGATIDAEARAAITSIIEAGQ